MVTNTLLNEPRVRNTRRIIFERFSRISPTDLAKRIKGLTQKNVSKVTVWQVIHHRSKTLWIRKALADITERTVEELFMEDAIQHESRKSRTPYKRLFQRNQSD
jgi:hypothetical protein